MATRLWAFVLVLSTAGLLAVGALPVDVHGADDGGGGGKATVKVKCPNQALCPGECECTGKKCWGSGSPWCNSPIRCECDNGEVRCENDCTKLVVW